MEFNIENQSIVIVEKIVDETKRWSMTKEQFKKQMDMFLPLPDFVVVWVNE